MKNVILVTGGAGYIGSHTCKALALSGFQSVVLDNLSSGRKDFVKWGPLVEGNIQDPVIIKRCVSAYQPVAVIHFAGKINVSESMKNPDLYYRHNVEDSISFFETLFGLLPKIPVVFSSSAAVYGTPLRTPIPESHPFQPINPYGDTKAKIEIYLNSKPEIPSISFRYFNAAGADPDGELGESHDPETHLIPLLLRATASAPIPLYGDDYPTPDGTCIRDYIHVCDLANAHVLAVQSLLAGGVSAALNLGTGHGYSIKEVVDTAACVVGKPLHTVLAPRREGDPPILVADAQQARERLGWIPELSDLETILSHAWAWEQNMLNYKP